MTRARSLSRLANSSALTVDTNLNVGIGSTTPDVKLDVIGNMEVSGVLTATSFQGNVELKGTSKINAVGVGKNIIFQDDGTDRFHFEMTSTGLRPETGNTGSIGNLSYPFSSGVFTNFRVVSDLNVGNNVNITGVVTATSFIGDGAGLTGLNVPAGFNELDAALFN